MRFWSSVVWAVFLLLVAIVPAMARDLAIVANPAFPRDHLSLQEVKAIYLGETRYLDSLKVQPVDQRDSNPIKRVFVEKVLTSTVQDYRSYWLKRVFREGVMPPVVKASDSEVLDVIQGNPGAVGYIWADEVPSGRVKVLLRVPGD